jgi:hypothetical protein
LDSAAGACPEPFRDPIKRYPRLGKGLDETGRCCVVIESRSQSIHGIVQALLEVHKGVGWPELLLQFFPSNGLARLLQQHDQDLRRLALQLDLHALFVEFPSSGIELECTKAEGWRN